MAGKKQEEFVLGTFTDPRDGRVYKTVKIGDQVWMAENLNYGEMTTDDKLVPGKKWCYDNDESNCEDGYGGLYTWEVAKKSCPPGWHLPTNEEWEKLFEFVASNVLEPGEDYEDDEEKNVAVAGALASCDFDDADSCGFVSMDSCRFGALPAGWRHPHKSLGFMERQKEAVWFSATKGEVKQRGVYGYGIDPSDDGDAFFQTHITPDKGGFSVRCVKDAEPAAKPKKTVVAQSKKATAKKATAKKAAPKKAATGKTSKSKARKG